MKVCEPISVHNIYRWGRSGAAGSCWLLAGLLLVLLVPTQAALGVPVWKASLSGARITLACILAGVLVGAILADRQRDLHGGIRWIPALAITGSALVPALLNMVLFATAYARSVPLIAMSVGAVVVLSPIWIGRDRVKWISGFAAATILALLGIGLSGKANWTLTNWAKSAQPRTSNVRRVPSLLYPLQITTFRGYLDSGVQGGGIAVIGNGYLAASAEGHLFYVKRTPSAAGLEVTRLALSVPINYDGFFRESLQPGLAPTWFRVTDLLVEETGGHALVFAAHNYWRPEQRCSVLRVSVLSAASSDLTGNRAVANWRTLYETSPCEESINEGQGGRLVRMADGRLLLSTGAQGSFESAQEPGNSYGKTVAIDDRTREARIFTSGHRNPQGLTVAADGAVWLTEHGPNGGDELNRLLPGGNFGWPLVSYGLPYSPGQAPFSDGTGSHSGFDEPAFAWVPSIGISNLIEVTSDLFPRWRNDLIVASLVRSTLWRVRLVDHHVEYVEEIKLEGRIRDIIQDPAGRIVLWTDARAMVFVEPAPAVPAEGEQATSAELAFARCAACHVTTKGATSGIGPNLHGVLDRPVATVGGYEYSKALRAVGGSWNLERLDRFLQDPQSFAPGARLEMQPISDASERRLVIEHLATLN